MMSEVRKGRVDIIAIYNSIGLAAASNTSRN